MLKVHFTAKSPTLARDLAAKPEDIPEIEVTGYLALPRGARGPVPAVVLMEGLGGFIESRELAYARRLADWGFAALVVDSFGSRGVDPLPHPLRALMVTEAMMLGDAFAALQYLSAQPRVDSARIFCMGFSYGGMISVLAAFEQVRRAYVEGRLRFAGHLSYYGCSVPRLEDRAATGAPVLMLLGELDRNVCPDRAEQIAEDLRAGGSDAEIVAYKDTYHQWDGEDEELRFVHFSLDRCRMVLERDYEVRCERTGLRVKSRASRAALIAANVGRGYHILRDPAVTKRSDRELRRFLTRHSAAAPAAFAPPAAAARRR